MLVTGTAAVPLFQSVIVSVVRDVAPTPVVGNVRVGQVMTNVEGVTADGVVGVLLEQLAPNIAATATAKAFANTVLQILATAAFASCDLFVSLCLDYDAPTSAAAGL